MGPAANLRQGLPEQPTLPDLCAGWRMSLFQCATQESLRQFFQDGLCTGATLPRLGNDAKQYRQCPKLAEQFRFFSRIRTRSFHQRFPPS